jgi:hypothetical protein
MPLTSAEKAKRWRDKHPDTYHAKQKRYYDKHPEKSYARVVKFRLYKSEVKRLMNIFLD